MELAENQILKDILVKVKGKTQCMYQNDGEQNMPK